MTTRRQVLTTAATSLLGTAAFAHVGKDERKPTPGAPLKIGLASYSYRQYLQGAKKTMTLFDFIAKAAEIGADGVELTEYYFEKPVASEYLNKLKRTCHLWGQSISCAGTSSTFTYPAGPMREQQIGNTKKWLDVAAELGAPVIRVFAGAPPKGMSQGDARKNVIESLNEVCEHAGRRGVLVAMENHHGVVDTSDGVLEILNGVQSPWFGLNLDIGNFRTADPYYDLARCAPYSLNTHYKPEMFPNEGASVPTDLPRVLKLLRAAGYHGYLTLEYEMKEEPTVAVPRIIAEMRKGVLAEAFGR